MNRLKKILFRALPQEEDAHMGGQGAVPLPDPAATVLSPPVLVIDDSPTVRKIVEVTLHREGYKQIHAFADGVAALAWLLSPQGRVPALILLDIEMPKMNGYEVARWLTQRPAFAQTRVIMLSRRTGVIDQLTARLAGARSYLPKPFTTSQLLALVERAIGPAAIGNKAQPEPARAQQGISL